MSDVLQDLADPGNIFAHLSYIFLISSMMMTSIRWLRVLALGSGLAAMAHFVFRTQDNASLVWESLFVLANGTQLLLLYLRSCGWRLDGEERELVEDVLQVQDPAQQRAMLCLMDWDDAQPDEVLMRQGDPAPPLIYIAAGAAAIEHDGQLVGVCGKGDFLGEMSAITGAGATATVRVTNAMRIARIDRTELDRIGTANPEVPRALDAALNRGLAAKVLRMNKAAVAATQ